jgi:hypothetical protein
MLTTLTSETNIQLSKQGNWYIEVGSYGNNVIHLIVGNFVSKHVLNAVSRMERKCQSSCQAYY